MKKEIYGQGIQSAGPYSPAILVDNWLFISGQIGTGDDIEEATFEALSRVKLLLEAAGMGLEDVVKVTVFVKAGEDFEKINRVYADFFKKPYPARSTVFVNMLPKGALIEIDAIARR